MTAPQPENNVPRESFALRRVRAAFTLIELLVVIALTVILFTLVFVPLIDSLNLTSRASTQIEAQGSARDVMRQIQAELSAPVYVYDNGATGTNLGDPDGRVNLWMYGQFAQGVNEDPTTGSAYVVPLRFGMVEFIEPASQSEQSDSTAFDPTTGRQIPPVGSPANVALPLVPGRTIVRYFVGLRDNTSANTTVQDANGNTLSGMPIRASGNNPVYHGYANQFDDATSVSPRQDNRTTLFRAEIQPYISDPDNKNKFIPNLALFHTYTTANNARTRGSDPAGTLILDDPNFFYDNTPIAAKYVQNGAPGVNINGRATVPMWECWQAVSQSRLPLNKADVIALERDDRNAVVYRNDKGLLYDPNNPAPPYNPVVRPLITFTPQYVENDPGIPASLDNSGAETPYSAATQYRSQYPEWSRPFRVLVYRSPDGQQNPLTYIDPTTKQPLVYEMDDYEKPNSGIQFQPAITPAYVGPNVDAAGNWASTFPANFFAFNVDNDRGLVNFAFPHTVLFHDNLNNPKPMYYNPATVNAQIDSSNAVTGDAYSKRFLWLHDIDNSGNVTNPAGAISPLNQFYVDPTVNGCGTTKLPPQYNVRIVPGSERVYGPDQNPGAHYGYRTQYTRVSATAGQVGRNQYKILFENATGAECLRDKSDPRLQTGYIEFDSLPDVDPGAANSSTGIASANMDPNAENPAGAGNVPPNYRTHSLPLLKQAGGANVAADPVEVSYSFQMNRPSDVVKIDYLTRSIMNVNMELRLYDPRSARPQTTSLTSKIAVRNLQR